MNLHGDPDGVHAIAKDCLQSDEIDLTKATNVRWLKDKTVVITGGASGIGSRLVRTWALDGEAIVVFADNDDRVALETLQDILSHNPAARVKFVHCDVTDWKSQVNLFKEAAAFSPQGGIDIVVANAGITDKHRYEFPKALDKDEPEKPNLNAVDVNLIGTLYTAQLALFWLPKNPGSPGCSPSRDAATCKRDRHLLLVGSMASLIALPGSALYSSTKHAVLGLFRSLRMSAWSRGVRVNLLCPYFIDTPLISDMGRILLSGGQLATLDDVVAAATRLAADSSIVGRSLCVGPKLATADANEGSVRSVADGSEGQVAIWEAYAHDLQSSELFTRRFVGLLNAGVRLRGWKGFFLDLFKVFVRRVMAKKRLP